MSRQYHSLEYSTVAGPPPTGLSTALKEYEAAARTLKIPIRSLQVVRGQNPDLEGAFSRCAGCSRGHVERTHNG